MMPVIDYGPLLEPLDLTYARIVVQAVMNWPRDAETRQQFIATHISQKIADLQKVCSDLPDPCNYDDREKANEGVRKREAIIANVVQLEDWLWEEGGHGAVARAPGLAAFQKEMNNRFKDQIAAGQILRLVYRMAKHHPDLPGGASVNKAVFVLGQTGLPFGPGNGRDLRKAWAAYKPVAHFCAAMFDWYIIACYDADTPENFAAITPEDVMANMDEHPEINFLVFLSAAEAYMEFGLAYWLPRAKAQPLLDLDETWTLPEDRPLPESVRVLAPLGDFELRAAMEYRAPRWDV